MRLLCEQFRRLICQYLATILCVKCCNPITLQIDVTEPSDSSDGVILKEVRNRQPRGSLAAEADADAAAGQTVSGVEHLLVNIRDLMESSVRTKARLRREKEKTQRMANDWMIAAAVIDRICFILIALFFLVGTVVLIVLSAIPRYR